MLKWLGLHRPSRPFLARLLRSGFPGVLQKGLTTYDEPIKKSTKNDSVYKWENFKKLADELDERDQIDTGLDVRRLYDKKHAFQVETKVLNALERMFWVRPVDLPGMMTDYLLSHPFIWRYLGIKRKDLSTPYLAKKTVLLLLHDKRRFRNIARATIATKLARENGTHAMNEVLKAASYSFEPPIAVRLLSSFRKSAVKDNEYTFSYILPGEKPVPLNSSIMNIYVSEYRKHLKKFSKFPKSNLISSNHLFRVFCKRTNFYRAYMFFKHETFAKDEVTYTLMLRLIADNYRTNEYTDSWRTIINEIWDEVLHAHKEGKIVIDELLADAFMFAFHNYNQANCDYRKISEYFDIKDFVKDSSIESNCKGKYKVPLTSTSLLVLLNVFRERESYREILYALDKAREQGVIELTYQHYLLYIEAITKCEDITRANELIDEVVASQEYRSSVGERTYFIDPFDKFVSTKSQYNIYSKKHKKPLIDKKTFNDIQTENLSSPSFLVPILSSDQLSPLINVILKSKTAYTDFERIYSLSVAAGTCQKDGKLQTTFFNKMVCFMIHCLKLPINLKEQYLNEWDPKFQKLLRLNWIRAFDKPIPFFRRPDLENTARSISVYLDMAGIYPQQRILFGEFANKIAQGKIKNTKDKRIWLARLCLEGESPYPAPKPKLTRASAQKAQKTKEKRALEKKKNISLKE